MLSYKPWQEFSTIVSKYMILDGDPNKTTRIIEAYENNIRNFADEYYELVYDSKSQHYLSLHSSNFKDRRARLQVKIKDYKETGIRFKNMVVGFSGRHIDADITTCGRADFINLVNLQGGKVLDSMSKKMVALIVGDNPRKQMVDYCKRKNSFHHRLQAPLPKTRLQHH